MRTAALTIAAMAAVTVHGDRLFDIPTGSISERGTLRLDFFAATSDVDRNHQRMQIAATKNVELTVSRESLPGEHTRESLDFLYNYVPPITEQFPGISFGMLDLLGRTKAGRAVYLSFSYSLPMSDAAAWEKDFLLHFGFGGIVLHRLGGGRPRRLLWSSGRVDRYGRPSDGCGPSARRSRLRRRRCSGACREARTGR